MTETFEERRDRVSRSLECRSADHQCTGFYDMSGSTIGYDTYTCFCPCHNEGRGWTA